MKSLAWGFACVCLVLSGTAPGRAQSPATPPANAAQEPQPTPGGPLPGDLDAGARETQIPEMPKVPDVRLPGERGISLGASAWFANSKPVLRTGGLPHQYPGNVDFQGKPKINQGFDFAVAAGLHNTLRFSYFQTRASGHLIAPTDLGLMTQYYHQGDYLDTDYRIQNMKISFEYLTWPYPVKSSRFRLKTLWQLQYLDAYSGFDAPFLPLTDEYGAWKTDANGNLITYGTSAKHHFFLPQVGVGVQEYITPRVRFEASAAGFGIPRHQASWDADASINFRFNHYELKVGARGFHFKTSPRQDYYVSGTMFGPVIALRWHSDSDK